MMNKRQDVRGEMAKRITITLPDEVAEALEKWTKEEARPMTNLATFIIQKCIAEKQQNKQQDK